MTADRRPPTLMHLGGSARRLRDLLGEVRAAAPDARDFALFDRRDDLAALGVAHDDIDAFDASDDDALDHHIASADAAARHWGGDDVADTITGGGSDDVLIGGAGDDTITVSATKTDGCPSLLLPVLPSGDRWPSYQSPSGVRDILSQANPSAPRPSYRPPAEDIDSYNQVPFLEAQAERRGFATQGYPSQIDLENNGRAHRTSDAAAIAGIYDLIKTYPQSEFVEAGVELRPNLLGGGYRYSNAIAGRPTGIDPPQWAKIGVRRTPDPLTWFNRDSTLLHTQPALGPGSLHVSGDPTTKEPGTSDVGVAQGRYGKYNTGQYMFSFQDGKLRHFDKFGREERVVHAMPNWVPR
jgi:hypothetical protein